MSPLSRSTRPLPSPPLVDASDGTTLTATTKELLLLPLTSTLVGWVLYRVLHVAYHLIVETTCKILSVRRVVSAYALVSSVNRDPTLRQTTSMSLKRCFVQSMYGTSVSDQVGLANQGLAPLSLYTQSLARCESRNGSVTKGSVGELVAVTTRVENNQPRVTLNESRKPVFLDSSHATLHDPTKLLRVLCDGGCFVWVLSTSQ
ncbi:hypothetical protein B0H63DRAFT_294472 [Podospora didyma]|uniref:Uncharacterized protein n=1 Tax=Podospora didyma TaxID=330526 RepID=A0AAE0KAG8_9PEZI|nr:hypothetical protein B0H63DRAFT_294472 [Podospora didyma]